MANLAQRGDRAQRFSAILAGACRAAPPLTAPDEAQRSISALTRGSPCKQLLQSALLR